MKILIALGSFKNYMNSVEGCEFMKSKFSAHKELKGKLKVFPMADGGENTSNVLNFYLKCKNINISTFDIYGKKITIKGVEFKSNSIFIGTSEILGKRNYHLKNINPMEITSYGLGYALKKLTKKYKNIYVGMGGTLIADAGAGAVEGLGGKFFDKDKKIIKKIIPRKISIVEKILKPDIFENNNLYFLMDGTMYFKDIDIPINNKIGSKYKNKKILIQKKLKKNIKKYFSLISKKKIEKIKFSANAGGIWLSFLNYKNSFALSGAEFISKISGIEKFNNKKNILITGEGIFDNSLIGKGPVYVCKNLNKIKKNYYLIGHFLTNKKIRKKGIFHYSSFISKKFNVNNFFLLKKLNLKRKNVFVQLNDFCKKFLDYLLI